MNQNIKKIKSKLAMKNISHFSLYFIHASIFLYIFTTLFISPFLFSSTIQEMITIDDTRQIELLENSFFKDLSEKDITLARENIISYYTYNNSLNPTYFSSIEVKHYKDVKYLYYFSLTLSLILSLYLLGVILYLIYVENNFTLVAKMLKFCIYILISLLPLLIFFEYFWVFVFHPFLFPQGGYAILQPQYISYYLFSHQFFLIIGAIIYIFLFITTLVLRFLITKLFEVTHVSEE